MVKSEEAGGWFMLRDVSSIKHTLKLVRRSDKLYPKSLDVFRTPAMTRPSTLSFYVHNTARLFRFFVVMYNYGNKLYKWSSRNVVVLS